LPAGFARAAGGKVLISKSESKRSLARQSFQIWTFGFFRAGTSDFGLRNDFPDITGKSLLSAAKGGKTASIIMWMRRASDSQSEIVKATGLTG
jgi:hypothetical protein